MGAALSDPGFYVWGTDQSPYGPVELPTLVAWVKDERVTADSWVYATQNGSWQQAGRVPELQVFFKARIHGGRRLGRDRASRQSWNGAADQDSSPP